jgi:hypothetical protein
MLKPIIRKEVDIVRIFQESAREKRQNMKQKALACSTLESLPTISGFSYLEKFEEESMSQKNVLKPHKTKSW